MEHLKTGGGGGNKLQALVYDILPSRCQTLLVKVLENDARSVLEGGCRVGQVTPTTSTFSVVVTIGMFIWGGRRGDPNKEETKLTMFE